MRGRLQKRETGTILVLLDGFPITREIQVDHALPGEMAGRDM